MSKHNRIRVVITATIALLVVAAHAQDSDLAAPTPSVDVRVEPVALQLEDQKPATLVIRITPPPGHHAYLDAGEDGFLLPIEVDLSSVKKAGIQVRSVSVPQGEWDEQFRATVFRRAATFKYELRALPWAKVGSSEYEINIRSQICNDTTGACYFPETHTHLIQVQVLSVPGEPNSFVAGPVEVSAGDAQAGAAPPANNAIAEESSIGFPEYRPRTDRPERGLLGWMLLAFVAGMVLNVMPCVLPVVSIKILSFVQQAGQSRRRVLALGMAFAAGMIIVFLALAVGAILLGLGWGQQFQSRAFLVVMIAVVFAFALSLFGVYELGVPSTVNGLATSASREGLGGSFMKGVLATVLATPCSGPFLGVTLAWTLTQPPVTVLLVFGMMGLGMAFPYVVLTANPALLKLLPKPGLWMETFKQVMGFMLLATVVYLMISLDQNLILFTVALLFFVATGAWIWGRFSLHPAGAAGRIVVLTIALLVVASGAYFSFGTFRGMFSEAAFNSGEAVRWESFDMTRLRQYHRQGRNVFVDFSADWCPNCKFNEIRVYDSEPIRRLLQEKNAVLVKADLTRGGPATKTIRRLMERLGARSIPFLAVFPGDRPLEPYTLYDLVDKESVSDVLNSLPDAS